VLCLIAVPLPQCKNPFAVKINNNKMLVHFYIASQLAASQEGLSSMELVNCNQIRHIYTNETNIIELKLPFSLL
jgi:hypothetical protein